MDVNAGNKIINRKRLFISQPQKAFLELDQDIIITNARKKDNKTSRLISKK